MRASLSVIVTVLLVAAITTFRTGLGLASAWPVIIGVVVFAARSGMGSAEPAAEPVAGVLRAAAAIAGAVVAWAAFAVRVGVLGPDIPAAQTVTFVGGLVLVVAFGLVLRHGAWWAAAAGYATFHGVFEPILDADPAGFLTSSPPALLATALALAAGTGAAAVASLLRGPANVSTATARPSAEVPA
ncbi:hypothetical protein [Nitriliruptor alkaliphilus]|uniref:hypothetical protein n=1 Tax=Nitriliruptor alkaliphilus TaxID=427918 RepID=UPI000696051F|nr:hypothetical protein [Nitriliruptor alkaliphilus]